MFILKSIIFIVTSTAFINFAFSKNLNIKIYNTKSQQFISQKELFQNIPTKGQLVLGEQHYQDVVQKAEGDIIRGVLQEKKIQNNFSVCWEFLNYPNQQTIDSVFLRFKKHLISIADLFSKLFLGTKPQVHHSYRHLFEVARFFNGEVIGINAPRAWKQVITKDGLANLDKKFIPVNMELGGKFYKERFVKAMGGHVPSKKVPYYFEAQSYTDSVMASSIQNLPQHDLKFIIVGAFHSDFNDGLVAQLKKYNSGPTTTIKIINIQNLSKKEIKNLLTPHSRYGIIADYIYMQNPE